MDRFDLEPDRRLTPDEAAELAQHERLIAQGLRAFVEVGLALCDVRDRRLYRATHQTFEDYCRDRWGIGRAHAYRLVAAAEVAEEMSPHGDTPTTEAQARALQRLTPPERAEVVRRVAAEGGFAAVTARRVVAVSREVAPPARAVRPRAARRAAALIEVIEKFVRDAERDDGRVMEVVSYLAASCGPKELEQVRFMQRVLQRLAEQIAKGSDEKLSLLCPTCDTVPVAGVR